MDEQDENESIPQVAPTSPPKMNGTSGIAATASEIIAMAEEPWRTVLLTLRPTMTMANFTTWFRGTHLRDGNVLVAPNAFAAEWLRTRYGRAIQDALGVALVQIVGPEETVVAVPATMAGISPVTTLPIEAMDASEPIPALAETVAVLARAAVSFAVATGNPASEVWAIATKAWAQ